MMRSHSPRGVGALDQIYGRGALLSIKKIIFICISILLLIISALPIFAANNMRLVIGGEKIIAASAVVMSDTVYIPADTLKHIGASYSKVGVRDGDVQKLVVRAHNGRSIWCDGIYISDKLTVPISEISKDAEIAVNKEIGSNTVRVMAIVKSIDFDGSQLKVETSYPVRYDVDFWKAANRLIVEMKGATFPSISSMLNIRNSTKVNIRRGMDQGNARIVLDMPCAIGYRVSSRSTTSKIAVTISGLKKSMVAQPFKPSSDESMGNQSEDGMGKLEQTPSTDEPMISVPPIVLPPITIEDISFNTGNDRMADITIASSAPFKYTSYMYKDPNRIVLDISNSVLGANISNTHVDSNIVNSFSAVQQSDKLVRLTIDLKRQVLYTISQNRSGTSTTIAIELPKGAGGSIASKIFFIDPGHGGPTKIGASGVNGVKEKDVTFAIAQKLQEALKNAGACAFLTRNGDVELDRNLSVDLSKRVDLAGRNSADFFISIHCNAVSSSKKVSGIETFYHGNDPNGRALAYCIHPELLKTTGLPDRKVRSDTSLYASGLAVLRGASEKYGIPSILIEAGFIDHPGDCAILTNPQRQQDIADAIVRGIKAYIEGLAYSGKRNTFTRVSTINTDSSISNQKSAAYQGSVISSNADIPAPRRPGER